MAITKVGAMTDPPVAGDYAILQAKLDAYAKQIGNQGMILTQWTNTTTRQSSYGCYITHGGNACLLWILRILRYQRHQQGTGHIT